MLKFSKMHGLGNDFMVIDAITQQVELTTSQIQFLADRQFGVGFDQLLMVEKPTLENVDFRYRIFNADGSEVEQCGNGVRCFARFVRQQQFSDQDRIAVETASGVVFPTIQENGNVTVDMGLPRFDPQQVPFIAEQQAVIYALNVSGESFDVGVVSMGNPHAVMVVNDVQLADVERIGPLVESHEQFPQRVNVGFMEIVDKNAIKLRVFERGSGETLACGTGACAAVVTGIKRGLLAREVNVTLPGGELLIAWPDDDSPVWMTGPAEHVFDGEIAWATINSH
jgi:diaminopimelate epimerase